MSDNECSKCGKSVDCVISMSTPGEEPTPPICLKCLQLARKAIPKLIKKWKREGTLYKS